MGHSHPIQLQPGLQRHALDFSLSNPISGFQSNIHKDLRHLRHLGRNVFTSLHDSLRPHSLPLQLHPRRLRPESRRTPYIGPLRHPPHHPRSLDPHRSLRQFLVHLTRQHPSRHRAAFPPQLPCKDRCDLVPARHGNPYLAHHGHHYWNHVKSLRNRCRVLVARCYCDV